MPCSCPFHTPLYDRAARWGVESLSDAELDSLGDPCLACNQAELEDLGITQAEKDERDFRLHVRICQALCILGEWLRA
jgi:hypothetical protein